MLKAKISQDRLLILNTKKNFCEENKQVDDDIFKKVARSAVPNQPADLCTSL
jgi:hypothetical protein